MTESQWLTSNDPAVMLRHLTHERVHAAGVGTTEIPRSAPLASARKLRLFACACCRLRGTRDIVVDGYELNGPPFDEFYDEPEDRDNDLSWARKWTERGINCPTLGTRAALLRDIFGNPFRQLRVMGWATDSWAISKDDFDKWLTWYDGTVRKLAQEIYDEKRFEDMPVLADALEEAGCTNEDILMHCRSIERCPCLGNRCSTRYCFCPQEMPGWGQLNNPHFRGCWVVDLFLGTYE